ncbi:MAG: glutamate--tRNA ligase family protein, partial [Oscillospiraceae bacterium]
LAELLFPNIKTQIIDIENKYPKRILKEGEKVTRLAPSPTGYIHLGNFYGAVIDERLAHQNDNSGIFYIRIEDTDSKRLVDGSIDLIVKTFDEYGLKIDEGVTINGESGQYGPYYQSKRAEIYQTFAKALIKKGLAYPCFCSEESLSNMRQTQEKLKENFGYYGKYASCRNLSLSEIEENIKNGNKFVLRFKSNGNIENKIKFNDLVKGTLEITENDQDHVLLKSDGIPTYHFAHVCDDYLMGTTHVVRGEEWLSTLPLHLQLFKALEIKPPKYIHTAHLMKFDDGVKRKLSKRKDPEASMSFYSAQGYPAACVIEYLMTLINSNYEEWRMANPEKDYKQFPFSPKKM